MAVVSENAIWERLIQPDRGVLPLEAAQFFLGLSFGDADVDRIRDLVERNRQGTLSPDEATELQSFRQVSFQLDLLRSKARQALGRLPSSSPVDDAAAQLRTKGYRLRR